MESSELVANARVTQFEGGVLIEMLTFEQLKPALYKWAALYQNHRFDFWELVSVVWLHGEVRRLKDIRLASVCARRDMIDYMRTECGHRVRQRWEKWGKHFPAEIPITTCSDPDADHTVLEQIPLKTDSAKKLEQADIVNFLIDNFGHTRREKLILRLRFREDFTQREIAKVVGVTPGYVSTILDQLISRLRAIVTKEQVLGVA